MSIQAIAWVLEHSVSEGYDRLVLLAIANHADARGFNAFPASERIAFEARVHRATVFRAIDELVRLGELEVVARGGGRSRANHYRLPMKPSQAATLWDPETVAETPVNRRSQFTKPSQAATPTVINQKQPSRARAREARPTTTPSGSLGSGSGQVLDWDGEPADDGEGRDVNHLEHARAVRDELRALRSKKSKTKDSSEEAI